MLTISSAVRIYLATGATDLRRSIDGLAALVRERFALDPLFCDGPRSVAPSVRKGATGGVRSDHALPYATYDHPPSRIRRTESFGVKRVPDRDVTPASSRLRRIIDVSASAYRCVVPTFA